jgi:predicted  nucleic acid-binding Zn-ribbon protein
MCTVYRRQALVFYREDFLFQAMSLVNSQSQSLIKYETELAHLRGKVASQTMEMEEKDRLLLSKDKVLAEMRVKLNAEEQKASEQLPDDRKVEEDLTEKLALKVNKFSVSVLQLTNCIDEIHC